jgi:Cbb3-type cytochrome oxidase, cytochrome c subunit
MWGTRRIGPDLAREYGKHPPDWQLVHLYNPRYIVPESVMPGFA